MHVRHRSRSQIDCPQLVTVTLLSLVISANALAAQPVVLAAPKHGVSRPRFEEPRFRANPMQVRARHAEIARSGWAWRGSRVPGGFPRSLIGRYRCCSRSLFRDQTATPALETGMVVAKYRSSKFAERRFFVSMGSVSIPN